MPVITDEKRIDAILDRGVITEVLPDKATFRKRLLSGEPIRMYIGADPTSTALHLSHAKNYLLLEEFRQLGHEVIVLIGDFTARIGDPSDRTAARRQLTDKQVKANVKTWLKQISSIIDFEAKTNPAQLKYNSQWLEKLTFAEVLELAGNFTVQQMTERDMFTRRLKQNDPIYLHEFLYPLMQGYDSVAMEVDAELAGTDQTFNALAGRTLLKRLKDKDKFVVIVNLMENPKTHELMSKSQGRGVFLDGTAEELYGAIMAQPDEMTELILVNNTRVPLDEVKTITQTHPREVKARAALEVTKFLHGEQAALAAAAAFERQFKEGKLPQDIETVTLPKDHWEIPDLLLEAGLTSSKSEGWRVLGQGGVRLNQQKVEEAHVTVKNGDTLQVGKRKFKRLQIA